MITTLTLNPSIDLTYTIDRWVDGAVLRAVDSSREPAGKGVNVARTLVNNGVAARAVFPGDAAAAAAFTSFLGGGGIECLVAEREGATRQNVTVIDRDGTTTKINESGPTVSPQLVSELLELASATADGMIAACGSIPPGAPADVYRTLAATLPDAHTRLAIDTSGRALKSIVGVACCVVKPNLEELEEIVEQRLDTYDDVIDATQPLVANGWGSVLVSLGAKGALLVTGGGAWAGSAPTDRVANTVGAGDALLSGYLADPSSPEAALASSLAFARAAVRSTTSVGPAVAADDRSAVSLHPIDGSASVREDGP